MLALIDKLKNDPELEFVDINDLRIDMTFDEIRHTKFNLKCKKCGRTYKNRLSANNYYKYGTFSSCNKCHPYACSSHGEKEIIEFVKTVC